MKILLNLHVVQLTQTGVLYTSNTWMMEKMCVQFSSTLARHLILYPMPHYSPNKHCQNTKLYSGCENWEKISKSI